MTTDPPTVPPTDLTAALELAASLAAGAIERTRAADPGHTRTKADAADFVTDTDVAIETWVRQSVLAQFPDHGFIGEELGATRPSTLSWYCDPVDGTTNYAHHIPWHSFSLALADADGALVGAVGDPTTGDVFTAARGRGAWLNGEPLSVPARADLTGSVLLTEWLGSQPWPGMFGVLASLQRSLCTVRIMGSSALTVTGLAAARGHAAIIGSFGAVDLMAAVLIAQEAGLAVRDQNNRDTLFPEKGGIVVAPPAMADQLHAIWQQALAQN